MVNPITIGTSYDGPKWTVNQLVKNPVRVPNLVRQMIHDSVLADWVLRKGPTAVGGAVAYEQQIALYANNGAEIVAEFGEIPMTDSPVTLPVTAATTKRGLGFKISKEMETRNDVGRVADELKMVRDAFTITWDKVFINAVTQNPNILTMVPSNLASGGWLGTGPTAGIRKDIANAIYTIQSQQPAGAQNMDRLNYQPDTLIIHPSTAAGFIDSDEVNSVFVGSPLASQQLRYTGLMPRKFMTLDVMTSWRLSPNWAIICQRNTMGFISDEWPLDVTPLRYNEDNQSYRSNITRRSLVAIDNPKSIILLNGIQGTSVDPSTYAL
ncbi:MAG TPA: hypothetical protein VLN58_02300 [Verrucomicrobiae bacterium]|nr:hypothetical protein [Verrucomicrobiae bacterium]